MRAFPCCRNKPTAIAQRERARKTRNNSPTERRGHRGRHGNLVKSACVAVLSLNRLSHLYPHRTPFLAWKIRELVGNIAAARCLRSKQRLAAGLAAPAGEVAEVGGFVGCEQMR